MSAEVHLEAPGWAERLAVQDLIYRYADSVTRADWDQTEEMFASDTIAASSGQPRTSPRPGQSSTTSSTASTTTTPRRLKASGSSRTVRSKCSTRHRTASPDP